MGTYTDSRYRTARLDYVCRDCAAPIPKGARYLNYRPGQRSSVAICETCSTRQSDRRGVVYWCADVEARIYREARAPGTRIEP